MGTGRGLTSSPISPAGPGSPWFPGAPWESKPQKCKRDKSAGFGAKPCMLAEPWTSLALKPRLVQGTSPSHRGQRTLTHGHFTHLLSRAARNSLSARFSVVPRFPLHKDTRHCQDYIQHPAVGFSFHGAKAVWSPGAPRDSFWAVVSSHRAPHTQQILPHSTCPVRATFSQQIPNISGMLVPGLWAPANLGHTGSHISQILLWVTDSVL